MKKLYFKDFTKKKIKIGFMTSRDTTDSELMESVNAWLIQTGVTVINVESMYKIYGTGGLAVSGDLQGIRVWILSEAKES